MKTLLLIISIIIWCHSIGQTKNKYVGRYEFTTPLGGTNLELLKDGTFYYSSWDSGMTENERTEYQNYEKNKVPYGKWRLKKDTIIIESFGCFLDSPKGHVKTSSACYTDSTLSLDSSYFYLYNNTGFEISPITIDVPFEEMFDFNGEIALNDTILWKEEISWFGVHCYIKFSDVETDLFCYSNVLEVAITRKRIDGCWSEKYVIHGVDLHQVITGGKTIPYIKQ